MAYTNGSTRPQTQPQAQGYSSANSLFRTPADIRAKRESIQDSVSLEPHQTNDSVVFRHHNVRAAIGLNAQTPIIKEHIDLPHHKLLWSRTRLVMREPFAEFLGVFVMVCFGNGSVAQVLLSENGIGAPGNAGFGNYQSISWG